MVIFQYGRANYILIKFIKINFKSHFNLLFLRKRKCFELQKTLNAEKRNKTQIKFKSNAYSVF